MHSFPSSPVKLTDAIAPVYDDPNPFQMFAESLGVKVSAAFSVQSHHVPNF